MQKSISKLPTQNDIFNYLQPAIERVINGFNCTIFTYGQTGSGKTYTMFGADWTKFDKLDGQPLSSGSPKTKKKDQKDLYSDVPINPFSEENGIIPRSINHIFSELDTKNMDKPLFKVYVSFLQIYNEKILDLLSEVTIFFKFRKKIQKKKRIYKYSKIRKME